MDKRNLYIRNATIYTEKETLTNGNVLIEKGKIKAIFRDGEKPAAYPPSFRVIDGEGLNLIPGFIDGHIHGANGADVMDATEEAIDKIASVLPKEGTTSFLATTITQSKDNIEHALKNISHYPNKPGYAEVIGIHLEGPFLEVEKKGAQPAKYILEPDMELFDSWQALSGNKIKTITMAPEHDPNGDFIRHLSAAGINVSAGHTNANFDQMKQAVAHGVRQVTHICNAMNGIHHRDIGAVGAALQLKELRAELIADGIHVAPEMIDLIYRNMGSERLILITDAMRAKCLQPGDYELGGQPVEVTEDRAILEDGTLAGSILKLVNGAKQVYRLQDVSIRNIIEMASENPAKQIHVFDRKGSITVGKDADILLVDDELNIHHTICQGIISYEEE
ncbi:N-acetylglucosamine-6-phosphate deacetylase [Ornithinibacillus gellani]|uniref:N-acetylglucosamine-6-phosphate deacetylase n=1 Tax=Ornithinibacillus gellani TaxID=2293253 RepID=UPI000F482363|nr:N-acetylglucosamine-6-phosphate deacetylase [Ornithinibacillus gellani]TQS75084.1 N-acetylglucosamine-6-phosphate deacetylase [Ornithinibacillus gellani]